MKIQDDRSEERKLTHTHLVIGTDPFLSGWGEARGGISIAAWACRPEDRKEVLEWVTSRTDMKRVREVNELFRKYTPRGTGHTHIYVVENNHSSLGGKYGKK